MNETQTLSCRCCIVGGGPAGMMLGLLLARAGVDTIVLEKHGDFLRDFRGDTIHPSTLEATHELGLLEDFLKLPHQDPIKRRNFPRRALFVRRIGNAACFRGGEPRHFKFATG
jgi:2-polyprenyl-6-methoxyphenol hydroxylase-like FAD-dependent oxidoreductase